MKNTENGLTIVLNNQNNAQTLIEKLSRLLIGAVTVLSIWGMGRSIFPLSVLITALAVLLPAMLIDWRQKWYPCALAGVGTVVFLFVLVCREGVASCLGATGNEVAEILTAQTGYYFHRFETQGQTLEGSVAVGMILGLAVTRIVRANNLVPMLVFGAIIFAGCGFEVLQADLWLAVYLLGVLMILAKMASGSGKAILWTGGLAMVLGFCVLLVCGLLDFQPEASEHLENLIHQLRYEDGSNPLPEGDLSDVGIFNPPEDAALEITMEQWESVYLRGFVGSRYTGNGWEEEDGTVLADSAELLYTLQKNYFHPFEQLAAANETLDKKPDHPITVKVLGACKAYSYLPYGIGGVELDYRDLTEPAVNAFTGNLYAVDEAYLAQKELSDGAGASEYLDAEAAYREWVYEKYLEIPEEAAGLLAQNLGTSEQVLTTTQAKEQILAWLDETLTYDEYATTRAGETDLSKYLVEVSAYGYSVHYATLGTLAVRSMGIPARYVEGYLIRQNVAATMGAGETLVLTQEYAHAWVEYYLDGIGWIPFEVTPGYENELVYQLPPDGTGIQNQESIQKTQPPESDEPPIKQETDPGSQTKLHATKIIQNILLLILLLELLAFLARMIFLRKKLKKRVSRFHEENSREVLLDCLSYQYELLETMGLRKRNVPIMKRRMDISQILFGEDVMPVLLTAQELSFSNHSISEQQRQQVLEALERVREVWRNQTPLFKRIRLKWIQCRVL